MIGESNICYSSRIFLLLISCFPFMRGTEGEKIKCDLYAIFNVIEVRYNKLEFYSRKIYVHQPVVLVSLSAFEG